MCIIKNSRQNDIPESIVDRFNFEHHKKKKTICFWTRQFYLYMFIYNWNCCRLYNIYGVTNLEIFKFNIISYNVYRYLIFKHSQYKSIQSRCLKSDLSCLDCFIWNVLKFMSVYLMRVFIGQKT